MFDYVVASRVNTLNSSLDSEKPLQEQSARWKSWFNELNGMIILAQNINKDWHIKCDVDPKHNFNLKRIRIEKWN